MTTAESWLAAILDCGSLDIRLLDNCALACEDVLERAREWTDRPNINDIVNAMFELALEELKETIECRVDELEAEKEAGNLDEIELQELEDIKTLDVDSDISTFHNFLDTHIYFEKNAETYKAYFEYALDRFFDVTGFEITG
jgi:hypothetical protein